MGNKFCMNCGKELRDGDVFCMNCGAPDEFAAQERGKQESVSANCNDAHGAEAFGAAAEACSISDGNKEEYEQVDTGKRPLLYYVVSNAKLSNALFGAYIVFFFSVLAIAALSVFRACGAFISVSPHWALVISSACTAVAVAVGYAIPIKKVSVSKLRTKRLKPSNRLRVGIAKWFAPWFILVVCFVCWLIIVVPCGISVRGYLVALIYFVSVGIAYILCEYVVAKRNAAVAKYLWGYAAPARDMPFKSGYDEEYEITKYKNYLSAPRLFRGSEDSVGTVKRIHTRRILVCLAAVMVAVFTATAAVVSNVITYKFGSWYANISVVRGWGNNNISGNDLIFLYGQYNFIRDAGDGIVVEYYGDDWLDLYEEHHKLSEKLASGDTSSAPRIAELQTQMATKRCDYLAFHFARIYDGSYQDGEQYDPSQYRYDYLTGEQMPFFFGELVGITLDKVHGGTGVKKKQKGEISCKPSRSGEQMYDVEIYYPDGSYIWRNTRIIQSENAEITLLDEWGNSYIVNIDG